jgi:hypothetical protein
VRVMRTAVQSIVFLLALGGTVRAEEPTLRDTIAQLSTTVSAAGKYTHSFGPNYRVDVACKLKRDGTTGILITCSFSRSADDSHCDRENSWSVSLKDLDADEISVTTADLPSGSAFDTSDGNVYNVDVLTKSDKAAIVFHGTSGCADVLSGSDTVKSVSLGLRTKALATEVAAQLKTAITLAEKK